MTKIKQNFTYYTGTDQTIRYTITDETGASVNMAGYSGEWILQSEASSGSILRYLSGGSGITFSGCTADVVIAASDTAGCALGGIYYSELSASNASSVAQILAVGKTTVLRRGY